MTLTEAERKEALDIVAKVFKKLTPAEREKLGKALAEAVADFVKVAKPNHGE
ncbi:MAG: hypothetical protein JRE40_07630, partial [Deltaproteobacteria bacterium]|nr:hypothetical protein [Deltaproteobacteria bacterium]